MTNSNKVYEPTKFESKTRLQLSETNAVKSIYYPNTYKRSCPLSGFHTDTNSHAPKGCRMLKGLYTERHDRCALRIMRELEKYVLTVL